MKKRTEKNMPLTSELFLTLKGFISKLKYGVVISNFNEIKDFIRETDRNKLIGKLDKGAKKFPQIKRARKDIIRSYDEAAEFIEEKYPNARGKLISFLDDLEALFIKYPVERAIPFLDDLEALFANHPVEKVIREILKYHEEFGKKNNILEKLEKYFDQDIENKKLKKEAEQNRIALEETKKLAYLGQMANMMAHNINNPVGIIRAEASGALDDIEEGLFKEEELKPLLVNVRDQCRRLHDIMENFRRFAQGDRQHREKVELNALTKKVEEFLSGQFQQHKIELVVNIQTNSFEPIVHANPFQLQEILMNLTSNAREAVEGKPNARIWLVTWADEERSGFRVEDNGAGVSAEQLEHLYTPFVSGKPEGTGLGLYFSHEALTQMGGDLVYEENPAGGACFVAILPRHKE